MCVAVIARLVPSFARASTAPKRQMQEGIGGPRAEREFPEEAVVREFLALSKHTGRQTKISPFPGSCNCAQVPIRGKLGEENARTEKFQFIYREGALP